MQNLLNDLTKLLDTSGNAADSGIFTDENGNLLKNKVIEYALKLDSGLLKLLLKSKSIKKHFFEEIDGIQVFDKIKFQNFVSNKQFLPDSYTAYKNKIGLIDEKGDYLSARGEVTLVWPYKDCILEGGQTKEDQKRDEVFWNETLAPDEIDRLFAPKVITNWKKIDSKGEYVLTGKEKIDFDSDNFIIKGNNLLALHSIYRRFAGKVKLIYIDPPYNTGGDSNIFSYNNTFNHSTWLTFMKNRLVCAKQLLKEDGFIVIAIDHVELFYLGVLADEIFEKENFISIITVQHNPKGRNQSKFFSANSEFLLVYAKNKTCASFYPVSIDDEVKASFTEQDAEGLFRWEPYIRARTVWSRKARPENWYPIYVSKDLSVISSSKIPNSYELYPTTSAGDFSWKNIKKTFDELNHDGYFRAVMSGEKVILQHKYREQQVLKNVWIDKKYQSEFNGTNLLKDLIGENLFSYPKSLYAVEDIIKIMSGDNDIVLDFFAGSGTTAHAVLLANKEQNLNRRFILIEQLEEHIEIIYKRLKKLIQEDKLFSSGFIGCEFLEWNEAYMEKIQNAKTAAELKPIWSAMQKNAFLNFFIDVDAINNNFSEFERLPLEDQKRFLVETLDKNQLYVNYSEMKDKAHNVSEADIKLNTLFYSEK
jgi:adenine-specific DNA-methyltransferase